METRLGLETASKTGGGQFDHRGYNTEVNYGSSKEDFDFRNVRTRQAGTGEW